MYIATTSKASSRPIAVNVKPRVRVSTFGRTRVVRVTAARSFVHRYALVQVWRSRSRVWSSVMRVRLTRSTAGISPTVTSTGAFRLRMRHGLRLRVLMPSSQVSPGYVAGASNVART